MDARLFTELDVWLGALLALLICALLIHPMSRLARRIHLVDLPSRRKLHESEVPLVGGICIYLATLISTALVHYSTDALMPLIVGTGLVVLGVIDDRVGLSSLIRFPVQVITALIMISVGNVGIQSVGNITGLGAVEMSVALSLAFTVVCTVGVINSINMIDGVDGLSGSVIGITLATLAYFCYQAGDMGSVALLMALIAANCSFLFYNARFFRSRAVVFMGDAGSTLFGLLIVWFFIRLTQGENATLSPVAAGWIFGVPLMDTVSVMVGRVLQKRSPFSADREHLHHRLLRAGLTPNQVVCAISALQLLLVSGGLICNALPQLEPVFFWGFVALVVAHHFLTPRLLGVAKPSKSPKIPGYKVSDRS